MAHKKIAFLIPAGEVVHHDRVVSYESREVDKIIKAGLNLGDTFVFEASLRLAAFEKLECFSTYSASVDEAVARLNECDVAILRGSNYINPTMDWGNLPEVIERSKTPVVAFGIGAQAPRYESVKVSKQTTRFLKIISERSDSIGCRGKFSASILNDMGIKNVTPIGCPSIFRSNNPKLSIAWPPQQISRVGFTSTRGFSPGYCDNALLATKFQLDTLKELDSKYETYVLSQGEMAEKIFFYRAYEQMDRARESMRLSRWDLAEMPWLEKLYWRGVFFGTSPLEYENMVKYCDLLIGLRLHGNIIGLSLGIPAIYITYDSRTRELVEQFSIPSYDILDPTPFSVRDYLVDDTFRTFNQRFAINYGVIRNFLTKNGVQNNMFPDLRNLSQ